VVWCGVVKRGGIDSEPDRGGGGGGTRETRLEDSQFLAVCAVSVRLKSFSVAFE